MHGVAKQGASKQDESIPRWCPRNPCSCADWGRAGRPGHGVCEM